MQTTLHAVETIAINGDLSKVASRSHEIVVDIPEQFHPVNNEGYVQVEYDEGVFSLEKLLTFKGGFPALALWDKDTYKEYDFPLPIISDKIIYKAV